MSVTHAPSEELRRVTAGEAMHPGLVTLPAGTPLRLLARTMAVQGVHAVALAGAPPAIVSDRELVRALAAGEAAVRPEPVPSVGLDEPIDAAAELMVAQREGHVLVEDAHSAPVGMLSSFDVAAIIGGRLPRVARLVRPAPAQPSLSENRLDHVTVAQAMHAGVVAVSPYATARELAALMAEHRIHAVVTAGLAHDPGAARHLELRVLTTLDIIAATRAAGSDQRVADLDTGEPVTVAAGQTMADAARLMTERGADHLLVLDASGRPAGMVSTLDVAHVAAIS